jgi:hypothetical protein
VPGYSQPVAPGQDRFAIRAKGDEPIHVLRKEFGSRINARRGIHAASSALRHSTLAIVDHERRLACPLHSLSAQFTPDDLDRATGVDQDAICCSGLRWESVLQPVLG